MSAMNPAALRLEVNRLRALVQSHAKSLAESEANRRAIEVERNELSRQVRNLTAEKQLLESRSGNSGRIIGEMRRQRVEALQAVARIVSMLAETPENIRLSPPPTPAPKDEAPF